MSKIVSDVQKVKLMSEFESLKKDLRILPEPVPLEERPKAKILGMEVDLHTGISPETIRRLNETRASTHETKKVADAEFGSDPSLRQKALRYLELKARLNPPQQTKPK